MFIVPNTRHRKAVAALFAWQEYQNKSYPTKKNETKINESNWHQNKTKIESKLSVRNHNYAIYAFIVVYNACV